MVLFNPADEIEHPGDSSKPLRGSSLATWRTYSISVVFAGRRVLQIFRGSRHLAAVEQLKPQLGVLLFIVRGFREQRRDLLIAVLFCTGGVIEYFFLTRA